MNQTPLLIKAIKGDHLAQPPVWLMRQAGRYLSEYLEIKEKHGFLGMCKNPELAVEVSLQPIRYLNVDAAIIFSDIMIPLEAMGIEIAFNPGPKIGNPIRTAEDIKNLKTKDIKQVTPFVFDAISQLRNEVQAKHGKDKAVIGFAGAPYTLACYIIEQGPYKHFQGTEVFAKQNREAFSELLEQISELTIDYLKCQVKAGADVIQIFDSWAGNLNLNDYWELAYPHTKRIIDEVKKTGTPVILYASGSSHLLPLLREIGADCLSIDWKISLAEARILVGPDICLQGNFSPTDLFMNKEEIPEKVRETLSGFDYQNNYIANLGHGILPKTPRENVLEYVKSIKNLYI